MNMKRLIISLMISIAGLSLNISPAFADKMDNHKIYTQGTGKANVTYPDWFKLSFYDIPEDISDAKAKGKKGVAYFVSQKNCNHCESMIRLTLKDASVIQRLQKYYDVAGMDIFSDNEIIKPDGSMTTIAKFVQDERAYLTPTMIFYHPEQGRVVKIVGFYPPEKFNHVLDFLDGQHYKQTTISKYLRSLRKVKQTSNNIAKSSVVNDTMYKKIQNKRGFGRPTMVLFTQPNCNPCKRFYDRVLSRNDIRNMLQRFNSYQVDTINNSNLIKIPQGEILTPHQWTEQLDLSYEVAVVFFDENGKEVFRLDAESGHKRMLISMKYVLAKGYLEENQVQRWVRSMNIEEMKAAKK